MDLLIQWCTVLGDASAKSPNNKQLRTLILSVQDEKLYIGYTTSQFGTWRIGRSVSHCHSESDILMTLISQLECLFTAWYNGLGLSIGFLTLYFCSNPWWTAYRTCSTRLLSWIVAAPPVELDEIDATHKQLQLIFQFHVCTRTNLVTQLLTSKNRQNYKQRVQAQFKLHM